MLLRSRSLQFTITAGYCPLASAYLRENALIDWQDDILEEWLVRLVPTHRLQSYGCRNHLREEIRWRLFSDAASQMGRHGNGVQLYQPKPAAVLWGQLYLLLDTVGVRADDACQTNRHHLDNGSVILLEKVLRAVLHDTEAYRSLKLSQQHKGLWR